MQPPFSSPLLVYNSLACFASGRDFRLRASCRDISSMLPDCVFLFHFSSPKINSRLVYFSMAQLLESKMNKSQNLRKPLAVVRTHARSHPMQLRVLLLVRAAEARKPLASSPEQRDFSAVVVAYTAREGRIEQRRALCASTYSVCVYA